MSSDYTLSQDVHLPLPTAVWVLGAHLYAVLMPFALVAAALHHWESLAMLTDYRGMLLIAAGLMIAGSAFEVAQNAIDRWYLTPEAASAEGSGFCDMMFYWCIVAGQAAVIVAFAGSYLWLTVLAGFFALIFPAFYLRQLAPTAVLGALGMVAVIAAYLRLGDPVVFLQVIMSPVTLFFFGVLLKTGAQVLHGFTTMAASSSVLFLAWAIHGGSTGNPQSWWMVALIAVGLFVLLRLSRQSMEKLRPTSRPVA